MSTAVHTIAEVGFAKGTNELYDSARPSYPRESISFIKKAVGTTSPLNIVEIGAGTGLFTRAFLADDNSDIKIASLKAFEPSPGMRDVFQQKVIHDAVTISYGTFDNVPAVQDGWADLIIIAQAFHWCSDYGEACKEFARILKPGGLVAFIWNIEDSGSAAWVAQLRSRIEIHEKGSPQFRPGIWRQAFSTEEYKNNFEPPEETIWAYHLEASEDACVNRTLSKSYIAVLPPVEKDKVIEDIKGIVVKGEGKVWIDESKGVFQYPYKTKLVLSRKV